MVKQLKQWQTLFWGAPKSLQMVIAAMKLKDAYLLLGRKVMTNLDSILKSRDITLPTNVHLVKAMVFPVYGCWQLDYKESWVPKNWCFWTVVLEKTLESPLDCKEIQPVHSEGDQPFGISLEGMMLKLKLQYFGHLMRRVDSLEKTDAGRDWGQEEKGTTEDEMAKVLEFQL